LGHAPAAENYLAHHQLLRSAAMVQMTYNLREKGISGRHEHLLRRETF
jgi:hypothetical protein